MLHIGERVMVRNDLVPGESYDGVYFNKGMKSYTGKVGRIRDIEDGFVSLSTDKGLFYWSSEMLVALADKKCICGMIQTGIGADLLSIEEYEAEIKREPVLTKKKFTRFAHCPKCGRFIYLGDI